MRPSGACREAKQKQKRAARRRAEVHDGTWNVGHSSVKMQMNRLRQEIGGRRFPAPPLPPMRRNVDVSGRNNGRRILSLSAGAR